MPARSGEYYLSKAIAFYAKSAPGTLIRQPADVGLLLRPYGLKEQEYFLAVTLDGSHQVIAIHEITKGILNKTMVHPREVFRPAIADNAAAIIVAHNHPSGSFDASPEDNDITFRLKEAGKIIGIPVLDHIILTSRGHVSISTF